MGLKEWIPLLLLSVIWGASFFFVEVTVKQMTPLTILLCRVSMASLLLLGFVKLMGRKIPVDLRLWGAFLMIGALNNVIPFQPDYMGSKSY